ncbi:MAG: hypothetical protein JWL73_3074 [Actinomycetia bacterium]|nr:hypothetical protein [Actinomycetes bacterium]
MLERPPSWWSRRSPLQRIAFLATAVVVGVSTLVLVSQAKTPPNNPTVNSANTQVIRTGAYRACQGFVKDHLDAPATAVFDDPAVTVARGAATGEWTIQGVVTSRNRFGATLRQRFLCRVLTTNAGDTWAEEEVAIEP